VYHTNPHTLSELKGRNRAPLRRSSTDTPTAASTSSSRGPIPPPQYSKTWPESSAYVPSRDAPFQEILRHDGQHGGWSQRAGNVGNRHELEGPRI